MHPRRRSIVLGVTSATSLILLDGFPEFLASRAWDVHLVSAPGERSARMRSSTSVTVHELPMTREPAPMADAIALVRWVRLLTQLKPSVVSVGTPKAGLLGLIAAWIVRVPHRVYLLRGLRLETESGFRYLVLRVLEKLSGLLATDVVAVSPSLRNEAIELGLVAVGKITVLGDGSSNGVDLERFRPEGLGAAGRDELAAALGLDLRRPVVGYVGRLSRDKGLVDLAMASKRLHAEGLDHQLLIVGDVEADYRNPWADAGLQGKQTPVVTGFVEDTGPYYQLMDVLCLPTRREGFPNVVLEAAASGVPAVTTTATGARDSVLDGVTGYLVPPGDPEQLAKGLGRVLATNSGKLGEQAREFVTRRFARDRVWRLYSEFYERE